MSFHLTDYSIACEMDWLVSKLRQLLSSLEREEEEAELLFRGVPFKLSIQSGGEPRVIFGLQKWLWLECGRWDKHVIARGTAALLLGCLLQAIPSLSSLPCLVPHGDEGNELIGASPDGLLKYTWNPQLASPPNAPWRPVIRETVLEATFSFTEWLADINQDRGWFPWTERRLAVRLREEFGRLRVILEEGELWEELPPVSETPTDIADALLRYDAKSVWQSLTLCLHDCWHNQEHPFPPMPDSPSLVREKLSLLAWLRDCHRGNLEREEAANFVIPKMVGAS